MSTLSIENRDQLINNAENIFSGDDDFAGCCRKIVELAQANYSDCVEGLTGIQVADLREAVDHIEYSVGVHQGILESKTQNIGSEPINQQQATAKEALEVEIMAIFRSWPVF